MNPTNPLLQPQGTPPHGLDTWDPEAAHRLPQPQDHVFVLGTTNHHNLTTLQHVSPGQTVAFQGRLFQTDDADNDGRLELWWNGDVLARVVHTFSRDTSRVIHADIAYSHGSNHTITGTPNHPFWVPAEQDYVPLGELEVGTALNVQGGGEAILVSKTWRQGDYEVFDFEVEGLHNFYVRGQGSDAAGVLVHNSTRTIDQAAMARGRASEARVLGDIGVPKNTTKLKQTEANTIPDGLTATDVIEVKDTKSVNNSKQIRAQREHAEQTGKDFTIYTGDKTKVSKTLTEADDVNIVRRPDLGPQ